MNNISKKNNNGAFVYDAPAYIDPKDKETKTKEHLKKKMFEYLFDSSWKKTLKIPKNVTGIKNKKKEQELFQKYRPMLIKSEKNLENKPSQSFKKMYMVGFYCHTGENTNPNDTYKLIEMVNQDMYGNDKKRVNDDFAQEGDFKLLFNQEQPKDVLFRVNVKHKVNIFSIKDRTFDIVGNLKQTSSDLFLNDSNYNFDFSYCALKDMSPSMIESFKLEQYNPKGNHIRANLYMSGWLIVPSNIQVYEHYMNKQEGDIVDFKKIFKYAQGVKKSKESRFEGLMGFHFIHCDPKISLKIPGLTNDIIEKHMISQVFSVLKHFP